MNLEKRAIATQKEKIPHQVRMDIHHGPDGEPLWRLTTLQTADEGDKDKDSSGNNIATCLMMRVDKVNNSSNSPNSFIPYQKQITSKSRSNLDFLIVESLKESADINDNRSAYY